MISVAAAGTRPHTLSAARRVRAVVVVLVAAAVIGGCAGGQAPFDNAAPAASLAGGSLPASATSVMRPAAESYDAAEAHVPVTYGWSTTVHDARLSLAAPTVMPRRAAVAALVPPGRDPVTGRLPKGGGYHKVGKPYEINGVRYVPRHEPDYSETGIASWYGPGFHGKKTANGETYDMGALTAAHRTLPLPSFAYVTNIANGRRVMVRVNDRGPFRKNRIIDVSERVAHELGFKHLGTAEVKVEYAGPAPLDGRDHREQAYLARQATQ